MNRLVVVIWLAVVVLVTVVTGCTTRYDSRLTAADGLIQQDPDSTLALVEAVEPATLATEGDRAYRDLLLTQARYRCYVTATSDSDINRALNYYRRHDGEREKLTRAYIYKGAVMEELGHPDSAMHYYKHAEATAAPDDYFNLGYGKLRIAELYQAMSYQDSVAITRLLDAEHYFELLQDTNYMIVANGKLGSLSGIHCPDSTKRYLTRAIELSKQFKPSLQYTYKSKLAGVYLDEGDYVMANKLSMDVLNNGQEDSYDLQFYFYAASSFIKLKQLDSARYILGITPEPVTLVDSMNRYDLLAAMALAENNHDDYGFYMTRSKDITSRILASKQDQVLTKSELGFEVKRLEKNEHNSLKRTKRLFLILALSIILIVSLMAIMRKNYEKHQKEKLLIMSELENALTQLADEQKHRKDVSELVKYRISALNDLYQDVRVRIGHGGKTKTVIPLSHLFSIMNEKNEILTIKPSESFWKKIKQSVDGEFNGIASFVEKNYTCLTDDDLHLFYLICANISPQIIKLCMNYLNAKTVSNYRRKLVKKMTGQDMSFDEFIQHYLDGKLN